MKGRIGFMLMALLGWSLHVTAQTNTFDRSQMRNFLREAREAYERGEDDSLQKAIERFRALREQAPEGEFNPDALRLAEGMSLLRAEKPEEALQALETIEGFAHPEDQAQWRTMKGNAHLALGEASIEAQNWSDAKTSMQAAIDAYKNALKTQPTSEAARHNLELSHRRLQHIREQEPPPQEQKQDQDQEQEDENEEKDEQEQDQQDSAEDPSEDSQDQADQPEDQPEDPTDQSKNSQDRSDPREDSSDDPKDDASNQNEDSREDSQAPDSSSPGESPPLESDDLDAKQAREILDAYLEQEKRQRRQIMQQRVRPIPVEKDW